MLGLLVVHYLVDLQSVHGFRCYDNIAPNAKCQRVLVHTFCLVIKCGQRIMPVNIMTMFGGNWMFTKAPCNMQYQLKFCQPAVRKIPFEKTCNRWMTSKVADSHRHCRYSTGHTVLCITSYSWSGVTTSVSVVKRLSKSSVMSLRLKTTVSVMECRREGRLFQVTRLANQKPAVMQ